MNGLFVELEDRDTFITFMNEQLGSAPAELNSVMHVSNNCDQSLIEYAADEYQQNIAKFSVLLHSKNPDQYKRAGALLHALYQTKPITTVTWESTPEELAAGYTRVTQGDAEFVLPFAEFYDEFHNEMMAFDIAFRCCASYEGTPVSYDFDYLRNVCRYLKSNGNLSVDSLFMLFKSLMFT